jgi:hypothetical protein
MCRTWVVSVIGGQAHGVGSKRLAAAADFLSSLISREGGTHALPQWWTVMSHTNGNAAATGVTVDAAMSSHAPRRNTFEYVLGVRRCEDGFTATLWPCAADQPRVATVAGPFAAGVAATAEDAMVAAIADARIQDPPELLIVNRPADEYDPPTL